MQYSAWRASSGSSVPSIDLSKAVERGLPPAHTALSSTRRTEGGQACATAFYSSGPERSRAGGSCITERTILQAQASDFIFTNSMSLTRMVLSTAMSSNGVHTATLQPTNPRTTKQEPTNLTTPSKTSPTTQYTALKLRTVLFSLRGGDCPETRWTGYL